MKKLQITLSKIFQNNIFTTNIYLRFTNNNKIIIISYIHIIWKKYTNFTCWKINDKSRLELHKKILKSGKIIIQNFSDFKGKTAFLEKAYKSIK